MDAHVVFFFGAGVSSPTLNWGESQVDRITRTALCGRLVKTEYGRYVLSSSIEKNPKIGERDDSSAEYVQKVQDFLDTVREHAETVLDQFGQQVTYEQLYGLAGEVVTDQEERESAVDSVNPAIRHFSETLWNEAADLLLDDSDNPLFHTANEATFLISGVVRELLSEAPDEIEGFDPLLDAIRELDRVTIVTLNHDLLLEQLLDENGIRVVDGFEQTEDRVRQYNPELLFDERGDVTVIKPHGSINWYIDKVGDQNNYISYPIDDPVPEPEALARLSKPEPSILSGYRKEERYTTDIFGGMIDAFRQALNDTNTVVESGFGWTDYGMYHHLHRYLQQRDRNRLLLLHPEGDFPDHHPFSIPRGFSTTPDGLIDESLRRFMCQTSWNDIKTSIEQS